jgi:hypothetical protein
MAAPDFHGFLAKRQQLDLLRILGSKREDDELDDATNGEEDEGPKLSSCPAPSRRTQRRQFGKVLLCGRIE